MTGGLKLDRSVVGQSQLSLQARLRHVTSSSVLLGPGAPDLAASEVLTVIPASRVVGVVLTPWAGRDLGVPRLGSPGISGTIEMLTEQLGSQCH